MKADLQISYPHTLFALAQGTSTRKECRHSNMARNMASAFRTSPVRSVPIRDAAPSFLTPGKLAIYGGGISNSIIIS